jgi:hypothetical protein
MLNHYLVMQSTVTILFIRRLYSINQLKTNNHENFKQQSIIKYIN